MFLREITNRYIWEKFLESVEEKTFLQSWYWGEFQKRMGNEIWRVGIYRNKEELIAISLVIKIKAKRGTFLFLPHGPVVFKKEDLEAVLGFLVKELKIIAQDQKCSFIRVSPICERNAKNIKIFEQVGFREAPIHMHPEVTWELDISPSEEELLAQMRKTTRYLIRQGLKNQEIQIYQSHKLEDIDIFYNIHQEVVKRQKFIPFSLDYLKKEFEIFSQDNQISIFLGKYRNEILASAIIVYWQGIGFYHHGATSLKYPKVPISYLLQWEAIREAKKRGCGLYNFWGIAPDGSSKKHPWWGLTLFKKGFGGYKKEYVKTQDLVLNPRYWFNWIIEKIRKKKRGL
ncbi:peptidoglycan bridge formation glycyltransferase FemA/FemB family protein [bacterium]|nr:peptidoglycan bridge formation glycyltransferase FemA/FemB family protein [bacterium]